MVLTPVVRRVREQNCLWKRSLHTIRQSHGRDYASHDGTEPLWYKLTFQEWLCSGGLSVLIIKISSIKGGKKGSDYYIYQVFASEQN